MPDLIYLAAPLSHEDPLVEEARYNLITRVAAVIIVKTGCEVFSPITHSHSINRVASRYAMEEGIDWRPTYDFWLNFDYHMLDIASWLYILMLEGWDRSKGIREEKARFLLNRSVSLIRYIEKDDYL